MSDDYLKFNSNPDFGKEACMHNSKLMYFNFLEVLHNTFELPYLRLLLSFCHQIQSILGCVCSLILSHHCFWQETNNVHSAFLIHDEQLFQ